MCSNLVAGGGRIGFANKVCGTALVKRNPDQFLILSEQKMNEPFEFKGKKYNSFNEFAKTKPGLWKNLTRSAAKFGRYAASPTTLLGGEIWYTVLDTMASMDKGIKWNEALDNAFFLYDFDQGKKNMFAKGKELGWSDAQIQDATQVFDLAKNQKNIENKEAHIEGMEEDIKYWQKPTGEIPFAPGVEKLHLPELTQELELLKKDLSSLSETQDQAWSNYQSGKTKAEMDKGFGLPYDLAQEVRREELIKRRNKFKRDPNPYRSTLGGAFHFLGSLWPGGVSPLETMKEKFDLKTMSDAELAEYNRKRGYRTIEELQTGPLMDYEMEDILGRNKWLRYLYQPQASGGRAGYMGGGITGIRKPSALPPTGGPMSQGLRSLYINDRDY